MRMGDTALPQFRVVLFFRDMTEDLVEGRLTYVVRAGNILVADERAMAKAKKLLPGAKITVSSTAKETP